MPIYNLRDVRSKEDFPEFYHSNGLISVEDKIEALNQRMGILFSTDYYDLPEERLKGLEVHCLLGWDRNEILPSYDKSRIRPGMLVRHFKGGYYKVLYIAKHSETKEPFVVYHRVSNDNEVFIRPYWMFVSPVDKEQYPDVEQYYRFEVVPDDNK